MTQPIYVMAHRCNWSGRVEHDIGWGANAIEVDVIANRNGSFEASHGWDSINSQAMSDFLPEVYELLSSGDGENIALLILDLKYTKRKTFNAARVNEFRAMVHDSLLTPLNAARTSDDEAGFYVMICMTHAQEALINDALDGLELQDREGINYDSNRSTTVTDALEWKAARGVGPFMYSSGIAAGFSARKAKALLRDVSDARQREAFGAYGWTFNRAQTGATWLDRYRLDGVLGNMNRNFGHLPGHLDHYGLTDHRLVTRDDVPPFLSEWPK